MTLRSEAPSATPDPYIATLGASAMHAARQVLDWRLDALRLHVGLVRVVGRDEEIEPGTARMIPTGRDEYGQNWCVLVVDMEN